MRLGKTVYFLVPLTFFFQNLHTNGILDVSCAYARRAYDDVYGDHGHDKIRNEPEGNVTDTKHLIH